MTNSTEFSGVITVELSQVITTEFLIAFKVSLFFLMYSVEHWRYSNVIGYSKYVICKKSKTF